jgi:RimJ/RimL family protein N-acetyltransferase
VAIENKASQGVAVKAGAMREGILRNRLLLHGKIHDAVMFSLIPK